VEAIKLNPIREERASNKNKRRIVLQIRVKENAVDIYILSSCMKIFISFEKSCIDPIEKSFIQKYVYLCAHFNPCFSIHIPHSLTRKQNNSTYKCLNKHSNATKNHIHMQKALCDIKHCFFVKPSDDVHARRALMDVLNTNFNK
jgi:hypothetical protein